MAWAYVIVLNIAVGIISAVLNVVPVLGGIVALFVGFYVLIIAGWLWGDGFAEATEGRRVHQSAPSEDPATGFGQSEP